MLKMKKLLFLFIALAMFACNNDPSYTIKIDVEELAGKTIVLQKIDKREAIGIDSVQLDSSGSGELNGVIEMAEMMYLADPETNNSLPIFMDNYNYTFTGTLEDSNIDADGGPHVIYKKYTEETSVLHVQMNGHFDSTLMYLML